MGVRAHLALQHSVIPEAKFHSAGTVCGACLRDFHHARRLERHLQHARGCIDWLTAFTFKPKVPLRSPVSGKFLKQEAF